MSTNGLTWTNDTRKLSDLIPWERNPRKINPPEGERLAASLDEFGQIHAIAIGPDGEIYDGHQRQLVWSAADRYGPDYQVDVRVSSRPLTNKEREKLVVYLHRGTVGEWNWDLLSNFDVDDLLEWGFEEAELGFDLGRDEPPPDPGAETDRAAELQEKWGTALGQVWALGEHRLVCGDCTDAAVVEAVMRGEKASFCFTDPPYGVQYQGVGGDAVAGDITYTAIPLFFALLDIVLCEQAWIYVCGGSSNASLYTKMFEHYFRMTPRVIVWDKMGTTMRHNGYHSSYEFVFYGFRGGCGNWWFSSRDGEASTDIWRVAKPQSGNKRFHLTEKPLELPERAIEKTCPPEAVVWEPFCGSGSTLIACERLGRRCRAIEIEPKYIAVTLERWATMTGREPELIEV